MTQEQAKKLIPHYSRIGYAKAEYVVADLSERFGATFIGIYDEPPSQHVDYLNANNCEYLMDKQLLEQEAWKYADGYNRTNEQKFIMVDSFIAGATPSSTVKTKDERIKELEDGIKWALDNPQSVFVFNELAKLLNK